MRTLIYKIKDILKTLKWKLQKIFRGYYTFEEWQNMLDEMIFGFEWPTKETEWYMKNVFYLTGGAKEEKLKEFEALKERALKGRMLFAEHFNGLWW